MTAEPRTTPLPPDASSRTYQARQQAGAFADRYLPPAPPSAAYPTRPPRPSAPVRHLPSLVREPPGIAMIIAVTFVFGLIGLIPTTLRAGAAARMGASTTRYWIAFSLTMAVGYGLGLALALYSILTLGLIPL